MDIGPPKEGVAVGAAGSAASAAPVPGFRRDRLRRRLRLAVGLVLLAALLGAAGSYLHRLYTHVYVDDARVAADMVAISSRVPGWVREVRVIAGDRVAEGTVLIRIDTRESTLTISELDARLAGLRSRKAELEARLVQVDALTASQIEAQRARLQAVRALLPSAEAEVTLAEAEYRRAQELVASGSGTRQRQDQTRASLDVARQKVLGATAEIQTVQAQLAAAIAAREELTVLRRQLETMGPLEREILAQRERAALDLADRTILMPFDGSVDRIFVDAGEYVAPGQRILLLHAPSAVRVEANVKETQLRFFRPGTRVKVSVDAWPGRSFEGTVERVGGAATSEFALLPTPNPSGNFTKITQRLPVRVLLDPAPPEGMLRPGMMVVVEAEAREPQRE